MAHAASRIGCRLVSGCISVKCDTNSPRRNVKPPTKLVGGVLELECLLERGRPLLTNLRQQPASEPLACFLEAGDALSPT